MFGTIGMPELLVVMVIALVIFGPRRLPELGRAMGQTLNEFKKGAANLTSSVEDDVRREQQAAEPPRQDPAPDDTIAR